MTDGGRIGEVVLALLHVMYDTPSDGPAGAGADLPPQDWVVDATPVSQEERRAAIQIAYDEAYIEVTIIGRSLVPIALSARGRQVVREWGATTR